MQRIACAAEGEKDISSFLSGANPAGRRQQGAPPPAPLPKGLRPFGIPLSQRIACAAEGEKDISSFLSGANPAGRRRDLLFLVAGLGADSCRGRRRVAHDAGLGYGRRMMRGVIPTPIPCTFPLPPCLPYALQSPVPTSKSRRRSAGFAPGRNACPSFPPRGACNAPHKRDSQGSQTLERGVPRGTASPLAPPFGGICPGSKRMPIIPTPAMRMRIAQSGILKGLRPLSGGAGGAAPCLPQFVAEVRTGRTRWR